MEQTEFQFAVREMLGIWSLEHREAQHSKESLDVLAAKYAADLVDEGVRPLELFAACRRASRRWAFFPKMADILKAVDEYRANPPPPKQSTVPRIEEHTATAWNLTPEELQRNKKRVKAITDMLAGKIGMNAAIDAVGRKSHIEEFRA